MPDTFTKVYPGNVPLSDTQAACKTAQQDNTANLTGLKPAILEKSGAPDTKVNVADFEEDPNDDILNIYVDLRLMDVSTVAGATAAAALAATHELRFRCSIFVANKLTDVEVYGKKP